MAEVDLSRLSEGDRARVLANMQAGQAVVQVVEERQEKGEKLPVAVRGDTKDGITAVDD